MTRGSIHTDNKKLGNNSKHLAKRVNWQLTPKLPVKQKKKRKKTTVEFRIALIRLSDTKIESSNQELEISE